VRAGDDRCPDPGRWEEQPKWGPSEEVARGVRNEGGEALFVKADVSRAEDVERLVAETVSAYGRLDAAFNNAATVDGV
jgi:NAD(P)-dependent dehydrogenase (short-subunit alcohol dehydrogenase family)